MPEQNFNIQALTNYDEHYWRVDWFGYLSYSDKSGQRRSEPLVDVYLSKFHRTPDGKSLNYKNSTQYDVPNKVRVPISYLRVIRLGDVWRRGKRVPITPHSDMRETFHAVQIDERTTSTLKSSSKDAFENYILPFTHHPYHGNATKAYCEVVKLPSGNLIVVPHYVLLQAYFSCSQYVFQQLFKFGLELNTIYDPDASYIDTNGDAFVMLKKWTHDSAASEVARIAFDTHAKEAVAKISQNLALQSSNNDKIRPKTKFPFVGMTDLSVFGKWCPLANDKKVFLVNDILGCTAAYPFNSLEYFRDNPGDKNELLNARERKNSNSNSYQKPKPRVQKPEVDVLPGEEPSNQLDELEVEFRRETAFGDLADKLVEKKRHQAHQGNLSHKRPPNLEDVEGGNTGDGESAGQIAPIDFKLETRDYEDKFLFSEPVCRLDLFQQVIQKISTLQRVTNVEFLPINQNLGESSNLYSFFPVSYTESGRASTWQYIHYFKGFTQQGKNKYQRRRALVARVNLVSGYEILLAEAERRIYQVEGKWVELDSTSILLSIGNSHSPFSNHQVSNLLEACTGARGVWNYDPLRGSIKSLSIKHPANIAIENSQYIDRQIAIIEKNAGISFE